MNTVGVTLVSSEGKCGYLLWFRNINWHNKAVNFLWVRWTLSVRLTYNVFWNDICLKWWLYTKCFTNLPHSIRAEINKAERVSIWTRSKYKNSTKGALTCSSLCKRRSKGLKEVKLNLTNNHIEKAKLNKETNSKLCKLVCVNLSDERLSTFEKFNTAFQSIF